MSDTGLTTRYRGRVREIVSDVTFSTPSTLGITAPKELKVKALWDTGATDCMISETLAFSLGLFPVGRARVFGIHDSEILNEYVVDIIITDQLSFEKRIVTATEAFSSDCQALIGMDIIGEGGFAITRGLEGDTTMSFVVPCTQEIDFVQFN